jgi:predicted GIY-YIG superfamily endonuclease
MPTKVRKPKAPPSTGGWFVYMVRCADGSLYTGVAKDVARRIRQHNDGTASRYTRSRRPVELAYHEAHPDQSSALKREAAIKALGRREKLALARQRRQSAKGVREVDRLDEVPSVGPPSRPASAVRTSARKRA